jgi:TolB-like protein/tRNA A-37 threonylcarbamoyl transferase component Bud32
MRETIRHYRLGRKLGEGGMGVVWAARDERLDRPVAIKMIREPADPQARSRLWREARMAAAINHPNICQLYEVVEEGDELFLVMELLEGESLAARLRRGPCTTAETTRIGLEMLAGLEALHQRSFVHRDLKPSNIFLTPHGVKLLDFGLARAVESGSEQTATQLTQPGTVLGTSHYMAPEQALGKPVDPRTDLFAAGAVLFEMLAGRQAFQGATFVEVLHAVLYDPLPALSGSPGIEALNRVIARALARRPEERYPGAPAMAQDLRAAPAGGDSGAGVEARPVTRLIVLPFRILRPDAETDFLAFSLPDAITSSLSVLDSLVVRSSAAAGRFAGDTPDLQRLATEAQVDVVLTGTLLRAGEQIRVNTQLVEAPSGTLVWSQTSQAALRDIFQLQDELVDRIVGSLKLPLTAREHRLLKRDVPASPLAYEYYLRANQLQGKWDQVAVARDLYLQCVEADPRYAPGWAQLGRSYRLLGKYGVQPQENLPRAAEALRRALELNPDLPAASTLYAGLECDVGRAQSAMLHLLGRAQAGRRDPELFAGLVHACRYCGLLEASIAAHRLACSLDPQAATSVVHAYFMKGDYEEADRYAGTDLGYITIVIKHLLGRDQEALAILEERAKRHIHPVIRAFLRGLRAMLEGKSGESIDAIEEAFALKFVDPEGWYYLGRSLVHLGALERGLEVLRQVVEGGYYCYTTLLQDPWLAPLRERPEFREIVGLAESRYRQAGEAFQEAGGPRLLGLT